MGHQRAFLYHSFLNWRKRVKKEVRFYTKAGCPLCQEARDLLDDLEGEFSLRIHEVDITHDMALYLRYRHIIPVVEIPGVGAIEAPITEAKLRLFLVSRDLAPE